MNIVAWFYHIYSMLCRQSSKAFYSATTSVYQNPYYSAHFRNTKENTKSIPLKYRTIGKLCFYNIANGSFCKKHFRKT